MKRRLTNPEWLLFAAAVGLIVFACFLLLGLGRIP
jgi:hypothetical protein